MDPARVRALFQADLLRGSQSFPGYVRHQGEGWAMTMANGLTESDADNAIRAEIDHFQSLNQGFEWKLYSWDTPADLKDRLTRHGFQEGDEEAIMVFDLARSLDSWPTEGRPVAIYTTTEQHLEDYLTVERRLGHDQSYLPEVMDALERSSTDAMAYVAYVDERPVGISRLHCHEGSPFGGCFGGSVLPEFRKQGCYGAMLLARAQQAIRLGVQYLQVDSLPTSRPILERLGFEQIGSTWPFTWEPQER